MRTIARKPTERQKEVLEYVQDYQLRHQRPPTRREIGHRFKIHLNAVQGHLIALERRGLIERDTGSRGIRVTADCHSKPLQAHGR